MYTERGKSRESVSSDEKYDLLVIVSYLVVQDRFTRNFKLFRECQARGEYSKTILSHNQFHKIIEPQEENDGKSVNFLGSF